MKTKVLLRIADPTVEQFFRMEMELLGAVCVEGDPFDADCIICDARAYVTIGLQSAPCVAVVLTDEKMREPSGALTVWRWPTAIREIREFVMNRTLEEMGMYSVDSEKLHLHTKDEVRLDTETKTVHYRSLRIALTERECQIFRCLLEANGDTVLRERLIEALQGDGNVLNVHICHLRKKLEEPFGMKMLETVHGGGYRLHLPSK